MKEMIEDPDRNGNQDLEEKGVGQIGMDRNSSAGFGPLRTMMPKREREAYFFNELENSQSRHAYCILINRHAFLKEEL